MTRYRLPEVLGGGEHEASNEQTPMGSYAVRFDLGLSRPLYLDLRDLTEVQPPLPPEPPIKSVVRAQLVGESEPWVFERGALNSARWFTTGGSESYKWEQLCEVDTPVQLVPVAELWPGPVAALPWRTLSPVDGGDGVGVDIVPEGGDIRLTVYRWGKPPAYVDMGDDEAYEMARAAMTAVGIVRDRYEQ